MIVDICVMCECVWNSSELYDDGARVHAGNER